MKITTLHVKLTPHPCFSDLISLIFTPSCDSLNKEKPLIQLIRRFRHYIVGLKCESNKEISFLFSFPNREILLIFREELESLVNT